MRAHFELPRKHGGNYAGSRVKVRHQEHHPAASLELYESEHVPTFILKKKL